MPRPTRILFALLLLALPLAARASGALRLSAGQARAGDAITIEWSRLPAGTHEVELELALDGGRWIRISPELEAREGRFVWRVPAGLVGDAGVRLRYGDEHEEYAGTERPIRLLAPDTQLSPDATLDSDEWWNLEDSAAPMPTAGLSDRATLAPAVAVMHGLPSNPSVLALDSQPQPGFLGVRDVSTPVLPSDRAFTAPRNVPLRN